jgi:hypothetical protein
VIQEKLQAYYDWPDGTSDEVVVLRDSIERDDGWTIPGGFGAGKVPEGRISSSPAKTETIEALHRLI